MQTLELEQYFGCDSWRFTSPQEHQYRKARRLRNSLSLSVDIKQLYSKRTQGPAQTYFLKGRNIALIHLRSWDCQLFAFCLRNHYVNWHIVVALWCSSWRPNPVLRSVSFSRAMAGTALQRWYLLFSLCFCDKPSPPKWSKALQVQSFVVFLC